MNILHKIKSLDPKIYKFWNFLFTFEYLLRIKIVDLIYTLVNKSGL